MTDWMHSRQYEAWPSLREQWSSCKDGVDHRRILDGECPPRRYRIRSICLISRGLKWSPSERREMETRGAQGKGQWNQRVNSHHQHYIRYLDAKSLNNASNATGFRSDVLLQKTEKSIYKASSKHQASSQQFAKYRAWSRQSYQAV